MIRDILTLGNEQLYEVSGPITEDERPRLKSWEGDLSELLQHVYDHLDGIPATMCAVDNKSFILGQMKRNFGGNE